MQMMWEEISFSFYYFINIFLIFIYILNLADLKSCTKYKSLSRFEKEAWN